MREKLRLILPVLFAIFLPLQGYKALSTPVSDNTDLSTVFTAKAEKSTVSKVENKVKTEVKSVTTSNTTTTKASDAVKAAASGSKTLDLTGVKTVSKDCNNDMSVMNSGAYYCKFRGSASTFIYGHNRAGTFDTLKTLKIGDSIKIKINGVIKTYKVVNTFRLEYANLKGSDKSDLRTSLYKSTYGNNWGGANASKRVTFQTCEGKNDAHRRYIQAVEV